MSLLFILRVAGSTARCSANWNRIKVGKPVETGANLLLWRPYDRSVLVGSGKKRKKGLPTTSAIQTYLDLKRLGGRGEEAAMAVYERLIALPLKEAAQQIEEMRHASL